MKPLDIQAGKSTPAVKYNPHENNFIISGSSLPENVHAFYGPILEWIDEFVAAPVADPPLLMKFRILYYNSGTIRCLAEILSTMSRITDKGLRFSVEWYYDADDDIIREAGEDLAEVLGIPIRMINNS